MIIVRWVLRTIILLTLVFFLVGTSLLQAAALSSPPGSCDEHPWDLLKKAYKIQVLVITEDYMLVAVWYTKDQIQPVIIRISLVSTKQTVSKTKPVTQRTLFFLD